MKTKILILLTMIVMVSISLASAATTEFVDPTPAEGSNVSGEYYINISNSGLNYHSIFGKQEEFITYLTFDESTINGSSVIDISGNNNNATGLDTPIIDGK